MLPKEEIISYGVGTGGNSDSCSTHNMRAFPRISNVLRNLSRTASTSSTTLAPIKGKNVANVKQEVTLQQAPNYPAAWSTSQRPRPTPHSGPRFEQTDMSLQPNPLSAMELIAQEPIRVVKGRKTVCDGGLFIPPLPTRCFFFADWRS